MIVISNTSPLIAFAKIDQFALLQKLFGTITIPRSVEQEFCEQCTPYERKRFQAAWIILEITCKNLRWISPCEGFKPSQGLHVISPTIHV